MHLDSETLTCDPLICTMCWMKPGQLDLTGSLVYLIAVGVPGIAVGSRWLESPGFSVLCVNDAKAACPHVSVHNLSLVLVQPRKTYPYISERLLMGRKNQIKQKCQHARGKRLKTDSP